MHEQEVRRVGGSQMLGIVEQMGIGVVIDVVEMPVLNRQVDVVGVTVARGHKRAAVVQLADPVIRGSGSGQPGVGGVMKYAALAGQP